MHPMPTTAHTSASRTLASAFKTALPVILGYIPIGLACGILESASGLSIGMCLLLSAVFYSGAGQFMLANLFAAGMPAASIILSIVAVSSRQALYSACIAPFLRGVGRIKAFLLSATVTDESFGAVFGDMASHGSGSEPAPAASAQGGDAEGEVRANGGTDAEEPAAGGLDVSEGLAANLMCLVAWTVSNVAGALLGSVLTIPVALSSFAMTAIFVHMLACQPASRDAAVVAIVSAAGVLVCKLVGLTGPAIVIGALAGVAAGVVSRGANG